MEVRSAIDFYERHPISADIIRAKLTASRGNLDDVAPDELLPHDQDHYGGLAANDSLAKAARLQPGWKIADFCAGLAGPARYYATHYGVDVTGSFVWRAEYNGYAAEFRLGSSPLQLGSNVLRTSVDGIVPGTTDRTATDTDRATFDLVP